MPTDELKQRIEEMKRRATDAVHGEFCGVINECQAPVIVDIATRHFVAEIERLQAENERLNSMLCAYENGDEELLAELEAEGDLAQDQRRG